MVGTNWMIYGANGYTGALAAREAVRRGAEPVLAGRSATGVAAVAAELALEHRVFRLDEPTEIDHGLRGVGAVLHCAGPFSRTCRPMVEGCLRNGCHYLDITGEIEVFERVLGLRAAAEKAGVTLLPGVGMDVVPSDCLAARLAQSLPGARRLDLAFFSHRGELSRGTLRTMIEGLPGAGAVRREGRIVRVPIAWDAREIPFSCGPRWAMTIPWGDVSTAFHTTGIPDVRVYAGAPQGTIRRLRRWAPLLTLAGNRPFKRALQWWVGRTVHGPGEEVRRAARVYLWGRVEGPDGAAREATLDTPEAYSLTAATGVDAALRVSAGETPAGAWTPAGVFGSAYIDGFAGVVSGEIREARTG